jgi:hypothetical protein
MHDPTELYARLMELRNLAKIKPGEIITLEKAKRLHQALLNSPKFQLNALFGELIPNAKALKDMLNTMPAVGAVGYAGVLAHDEVPKHQKGKKIEEITVYGKRRYKDEIEKQKAKYLKDLTKYRKDSLQ